MELDDVIEVLGVTKKSLRATLMDKINYGFIRDY